MKFQDLAAVHNLRVISSKNQNDGAIKRVIEFDFYYRDDKCVMRIDQYVSLDEELNQRSYLDNLVVMYETADPEFADSCFDTFKNILENPACRENGGFEEDKDGPTDAKYFVKEKVKELIIKNVVRL